VTPVDYSRASRLLVRRDPILATLIRQHGPCRIAEALRVDHFSALVRAIIFQQLSTKAASTIHGRLVAMLPDARVTPDAVAAISEERFRSVGVSRQKAMYLRDLCEKLACGDVQLEDVERLDDETVIAALTRVKGIGRWTAEMFLMFRLHRPDVLPVGDLGIQTAVQKAYGLRKRPTPDRLRQLAEPWKPYRSIACWYLWRSLDNEGAVTASAKSATSRTSSAKKQAR
jgi:DNA-3-methyladenine glycosylase II